ncbi:MAG: PhoH family protein [Rickettsiales bacterium]
MPSTSVTISFEDGQVVPYVYGDSDRVVRAAETEYGVEIYSRGGRFVVHGDPESALCAERFLLAVYGLAKKKQHHLNEGEIKKLLRQSFHAQAPQHDDSRPKRHPEAREEKRASSFIADPSSDFYIVTEKANIAPATPRQRRYIEAAYAKDLVFAAGPAGTGKTFLAVAVAVSLFLQRRYSRIVLCRPAVEAGEKIGFLPGDMRDKIDPYMQPLYDSLNEMLPADKIARFIEKRAIEITPLAFMRGRTLKNSFIILDEAQNATSVQMKMFLTRLGEGSKMIICGDMSQIDLTGSSVSGFAHAISLLERLEEVATVRFGEEDVVRHHLVRKIIAAYDKQEKKK